MYELTDHLGNVRVVFTKNGNGADLEGYTDYYPFGMHMPGRNMIGDYRYNYQGLEKDDETGKEAFELRLWDSRIGRWLTTDPMGEFASPYLGMGNNPISRIDPTGGSTDCPDCADTIHLNEVVVTAPGNPTNFSDRFPTMGIVGAEHLKDPSQYINWDSSFKGNLNDYNLANNTNYGSEREAYADWNYTFNYAIPQRESILAMHQATGEVAEFAMQMATTFVPVGKIGVFGKHIARIVGSGSKQVSSVVTKGTMFRHGVYRLTVRNAAGRFATGNGTPLLQNGGRVFNQHYGLNGLGQATRTTPTIAPNWPRLARWTVGGGLSGGVGYYYYDKLFK